MDTRVPRRPTEVKVFDLAVGRMCKEPLALPGASSSLSDAGPSPESLSAVRKPRGLGVGGLELGNYPIPLVRHSSAIRAKAENPNP